MELLIAVGVSGLISGVVYFIVASRAPVSDEVIQRRLENINVKAESSHQFRLHEADETSIWESITNFFMGDQELPERFNAMSRRLHQAGYRGNRAIRIFWGLRIFLCLSLGFGGLLIALLSNASMQDFIMLAGVGALLGYMLPALTVFRKARARVLEMKETLPDALD